MNTNNNEIVQPVGLPVGAHTETSGRVTDSRITVADTLGELINGPSGRVIHRRRPGGGRKKLGRVAGSVRLRPESVSIAKRYAAKHRVSVPTAVEHGILLLGREC